MWKWATSIPKRYRYASGTLVTLLVIVIILAVFMHGHEEAIRFTLAHWTGEEDLKEQIKGVLVLAYLKLTHSPPESDPFVPIAHTGVSPYGINTFLEQEADTAKVDRSLQLISEAGFHWIRQEFPWEDIEISGKGDFRDHRWDRSAWEKYDTIVSLAEKHGIEIIARLDNPPAWTRHVGNAPGWEMAPPDDYADYGDFVYAVVSRYKGRIRYYQIWNEPNIYPEWGDQAVDPAGYVRLLKIAYRRAKEADPNCVIIAAGLAQTKTDPPHELGPRNMSDLLYLKRMYEAGAKDYFDIMGAMVYGLWTGPYDRRASPAYTNFSRVLLVREIMVRHGDGRKPIWATEVGWNSLPKDFPAFPSYGRVDDAQQAVYAVEAYRRAAREWPWMGVMNYWFFRRPSDSERDQVWYYFRMMEPNFTPLPVYDAMSWLAHQPPTLEVGYHQQDHWALNYKENRGGVWQHIRDEDAVLGAYALGQEGAELDFYFRGTDLALVLRQAGSPSTVLEKTEIRIDGQDMLQKELTYRLPAGLAAYSQSKPLSQAGAVIIPIARSLKDERHEVRLRVTEGSIALDGLIVWRGSMRRRVSLGVIVGSIVAISLAAAVAAQRSRRDIGSSPSGRQESGG